LSTPRGIKLAGGKYLTIHRILQVQGIKYKLLILSIVGDFSFISLILERNSEGINYGDSGETLKRDSSHSVHCTYFTSIVVGALVG
jgi:hypothetical protein